MSRVEHIGNATLYLGDCREVLPTLGRFDAVVTDPPYGVGLTAKQHKWFVKEGDGYASTEDNETTVADVVVPAIGLCRKLAIRVVITPGTRNLWLYPPADDVGTIFNRAGAGRSRWGFGCNHPILYYGKDPYMAAGLGGRPNSWEQPPNDYAEPGIEHPCPKPLGMMMWLVARASLHGDTVLDPFMGTGTTGMACHRLGRVFTGVEVHEAYFDIACRRIEEAQRQGDLLRDVMPKPEQTRMEV